MNENVSVEYKVDFGNGMEKKRSRAVPHGRRKRLPNITRLLALAHHLRHLIDNGVVNDYADIARLSNLTRARLTQIMNLTLLAPNIQEEILFFSPAIFTNIKERNLRAILKTLIWKEQYKLWDELKEQLIAVSD